MYILCGYAYLRVLLTPTTYLEFEIGFVGGVDSSRKGVDRGLVGEFRKSTLRIECHMGHVTDETVMDCRIG